MSVKLSQNWFLKTIEIWREIGKVVVQELSKSSCNLGHKASRLIFWIAVFHCEDEKLERSFIFCCCYYGRISPFRWAWSFGQQSLADNAIYSHQILRVSKWVIISTMMISWAADLVFFLNHRKKWVHESRFHRQKGIQDTHRRSKKVVTTMFSVHDSRVGKPFCTNSRTWFASVSEYREIKLSTSMELRRDSVDDAPVPSLDCIQLLPAKKNPYMYCSIPVTDSVGSIHSQSQLHYNYS